MNLTTSWGVLLGLASWSLWRREIVGFFRQRSRWMGALATPVVFWLLLGSGLERVFDLSEGKGTHGQQSVGFEEQGNGGSHTLSLPPPPRGGGEEGGTFGGISGNGGSKLGDLRSPAKQEVVFGGGAASGGGGKFRGGVGYLAYFFPGTVVMIVLFTTIFTAYSVIEDRRGGFLQGVLASPAPRLAIVLGKVLGGATVATIQGVLFLAFWPVVGGWPGWEAMAGAVGVLFVVAVALTSIGFCLAWPLESSAGMHAILNITLFPMWFLSGAVFPYAQAPWWQKGLMAINPLTYGQTAFSGMLFGRGDITHGPAGVGVSAVVIVVCTVGLVLLAAKLVGRSRIGGQA
ncbi:MAG: ABC transporter permease [Phycisphaeraceae bacterium]|nr:ABC transporter permease [Phycisphaeraceae bacterium]